MATSASRITTASRISLMPCVLGSQASSEAHGRARFPGRVVTNTVRCVQAGRQQATVFLKASPALASVQTVWRLQQAHAFSRRSDTREDALNAQDKLPSNQLRSFNDIAADV